MNAICLAKLLKKNCRIIGLNRQGKEKQILFEVCMIKNRHTGIALFSSDRMYKNTDKRYIYTPPDLSLRFTCKVNL